MNKTEEILILELKKNGINIPDDKIIKLLTFINLLIETNKVVNLTAITEYQAALFKHIYDSLIILLRPEYLMANKILDLGSGGGIPGIPLAICSPEKSFTSIDSVQKKIKFQEEVCRELRLINIQPLWARAEEFARKSTEREQYDLAIARAVAPLNTLVEITLPFIKANGYALFYKGKEFEAELLNAAKAVASVGAKVRDTVMIELPLNFGSRSLIIIQKITPCPMEYPRKAGIPQKKPL